MKKISIAVALIACSVTAQYASSEELWDPHLRGVNVGLAAGALPPEGVYAVLDNYWASYNQYDNSGNKTGVKLDALVEVPIVLWSTGLKVFGADYAVGIAQPFDYTNLKVQNDASLSNNGHWGTFNTILIPGQLSWGLANDLHLKAGLDVYLPDAESSPGHDPSGGGVGSGNNFWTLQPELALSWLHDGWNVSVDMNYAYNFENSTTHYKSGQELGIDYTVAKTVGKWTFGLGGHTMNQLTDDSGSGASSCAQAGGCRAMSYGLGPLIGYQFPGVNVLAQYSHALSTKNDVAGDYFNIRFVVPLK